MKVSVQSVNFNIDKELVKYIENKINTLEKFHDNILGAEVFLKVQNTSDKENKFSDVKISVPGSDLVIKKQSKTFEEGISVSVDSLRRQLVKTKEKRRA
jgi:putative sigma-54 modulation protein